MEDINTLSSLNLETHPTEAKLNSSGGYRAKGEDDINEKFVVVLFDNETIVTGIATQGYGDPDIKEWVTWYFVKLTRQKSGDDETEDYISGSDGRPKVNSFQWQSDGITWLKFSVTEMLSETVSLIENGHK